MCVYYVADIDSGGTLFEFAEIWNNFSLKKLIFLKFQMLEIKEIFEQKCKLCNQLLGEAKNGVFGKL